MIAKFERGLTSAFYHGEKLSSDNKLNPRFVCINCAKLIRSLNASGFKRPKVEKRILPKFVPSSTDGDVAEKSDKEETSYDDLVNAWTTATFETQCKFMVYVGKEVVQDVKEDFQENKSFSFPP